MMIHILIHFRVSDSLNPHIFAAERKPEQADTVQMPPKKAPVRQEFFVVKSKQKWMLSYNMASRALLGEINYYLHNYWQNVTLCTTQMASIRTHASAKAKQGETKFVLF